VVRMVKNKNTSGKSLKVKDHLVDVVIEGRL